MIAKYIYYKCRGAKLLIALIVTIHPVHAPV